MQTGSPNAVERDETFQKLLTSYPRAPRTFLVAYEAEDTVNSEWLVRGLDGQQYKPEDYLIAFSRFVKDNPAQVEAIRILLDRPQDWGTLPLSELRQKLAATTERFTIQNLQKAHRVRYDKALVDIISMVKHAASAEAPLLTAEERVRLAFEKVTQGKTFTAEQQQWLDRIRDHLIENLSIEQADFEDLPVFTRFGGWGRANRVFDNKLEEFIKTINEAVAA